MLGFLEGLIIGLVIGFIIGALIITFASMVIINKKGDKLI